MNPNLKKKPYRNEDFKEFIRKRGCKFCSRPAQAHHIRRLYWKAGLGIKPHDYACMGLCYVHHKPDAEHDLDVDEVVMWNLVDYIKEKYDIREFVDFLMEFIESNR